VRKIYFESVEFIIFIVLGSLGSAIGILGYCFVGFAVYSLQFSKQTVTILFLKKQVVAVFRLSLEKNQKLQFLLRFKAYLDL
jgi:hypothetical protein